MVSTLVKKVEMKNGFNKYAFQIQLLAPDRYYAKELRSLNLVTAERRIIDVLLTIPRGPARSETLTDALTPPPEAKVAEEAEEEAAEAAKEDEEEEVGRSVRMRILLNEGSTMNFGKARAYQW